VVSVFASHVGGVVADSGALVAGCCVLSSGNGPDMGLLSALFCLNCVKTGNKMVLSFTPTFYSQRNED
jgi:hypothetical protein